MNKLFTFRNNYFNKKIRCDHNNKDLSNISEPLVLTTDLLMELLQFAFSYF